MELAGVMCLLPASALLARAAPGRWEEAGGELRDAAKHLKGVVSNSTRNIRDWMRRQEKNTNNR